MAAAAAANTVSTFMRNVLLIDSTRNNAHSRLRREVVVQGFNNFDTMHMIKEDHLPVMYEAIRKPGGMMPDPNKQPRSAD